ncbi:protein PIN-LIKES 6-like [Phoenix dactylifera]|uniref:Protein PIN-LIKES 6-like n=1 Tax=Phoenix dactylifera TaxID=42345 RepID=A0A8B9AA92_PHODC|nr:protein PIN-LIKES 6-like [Phoenix dactylifera]
MEKSLLSILVDTQRGGGQSILATMKFAILPIAKVFTICFMGCLMASKYVNILPANGRKLLNGLVFSLLLPCLIFSQLGRAITLENLLEWAIQAKGSILHGWEQMKEARESHISDP